ncbi:lung seven transmembrane receptor-domain-containing protein [Mycena rebaudengoi]|nr:lung seven transmembrane receptor-domain-containing protein [Mycena rebaudengoi]
MQRHLLPLLLFYSLSCIAYEVPFSSNSDYTRQTCSGMWGSDSTYINVTFSPSSNGQLSMLIYDYADANFFGRITSVSDDGLPQKTWVCTTNAMADGLCTQEEMGRFIIDLPAGKSINSTSFWSAEVQFAGNQTNSAKGFWDNPAGNPTPQPGNYTSPWRRSSVVLRRDSVNVSPNTAVTYSGPIQYFVRKTGYYCVAMVPLTLHEDEHPVYDGLVFFQNTFNGKLRATDYPKVNFYFAMFLVYAVFGCAWGWLCYHHASELLPIQYYLSGLVGLVIIEMVANWGYYRYLNAHGKSAASTVFLIVVAILDAGRNSMSFFMLLVVSLGLSVVRESLGRTMLKCQILAGGHFIFGILYAIGIVELELEHTSAFVLLMFVIPLAFTLSGFLLWIMYSLNATIAQLSARKQHYKLSMFEKLYRILLFTVLVIAIFFVVSTFSFTGRFAEDYTAKTWRVRWWLLDGWLALLYLVAFMSISYLWRPSSNNRRLAMSDELAQDEEDAEDYDLESMGQHSRIPDEDDDDAATLVGGRRGGHGVTEDNVVFEIGDEEDEDEEEAKKRRRRLSGERHSAEDERRGLMNDTERARED